MEGALELEAVLMVVVTDLVEVVVVVAAVAMEAGGFESAVDTGYSS